ALWIDALIESSIHREWLLNVGRRNARSRLAHLLCEFSVRFQKSTLADAMAYELPMTQEQLGDALGLTPVHVNRVLKSLETDGLIA
ncbi:Crp/Fnr family transcriptional regulator, partial [Pseudomonas aeruginosa]